MKFMNLGKWLYSNPQDKADDGNQGGGGGDNPQSISFANQAELDAYVAKLQQPQTPTATPPADENKDKQSIFDERQKRQDEENKRQQDQSVVQNAAIFDSQFDGFIKTNAELFPETASTIRGDVKETDLVKKSSLMAATAAKEFFSKKENIDVLASDDQKKVQDLILNVRYESDIDGMAAWELVKRSVFGHELANRNKKSHDFSGNGKGKTGLKNLDNYLDNFYPKHVRAIEA